MSLTKHQRRTRNARARADYLDAASESMWAVAALSCGFYRGVGTCSGGCYSEPSCQTDEPLEGWQSLVLPAHQRLIPDA